MLLLFEILYTYVGGHLSRTPSPSLQASLLPVPASAQKESAGATARSQISCYSCTGTPRVMAVAAAVASLEIQTRGWWLALSLLLWLRRCATWQKVGSAPGNQDWLSDSALCTAACRVVASDSVSVYVIFMPHKLPHYAPQSVLAQDSA